MKNIIVLGSGKSSRHIIDYLYNNIEILNISLSIGDINIDWIKNKYNSKPNFNTFTFNQNEYFEIEKNSKNTFCIISMLPANLHIYIAEICLKNNCHLITPSYVSDEMNNLDMIAKDKNLIFLNEMGFDPGIDHMSTMQIYDELKSKNAKIYSYKSYAGGLVSLNTKQNKWGYKFSWNPKNVILAGQGGTVKYLENRCEKYIPYYSLFDRAQKIEVLNNNFDYYANRDSLKYKEIYKWDDISTILRGTLRRENYCKAWNLLVKLGITDNSFNIELEKEDTFFDFFKMFCDKTSLDDVKNFVKSIIEPNDIDTIYSMIEEIGFFDDFTILDLKKGTPAEILQSILEQKWKLNDNDIDYVVMHHEFEYEIEGSKYKTTSSFDFEGENNFFTAMSATVGMPIVFALELILDNKIENAGVIIPISSNIYEPIIDKLKKIGILFVEKTLTI